MSRRRAGLVFFLAAVLTAADAQAQRYVAFGDSITFGLRDDPGKGGYPARLDALLDAAGQTATVENRGVDGETTGEGLSRLNKISGTADDTLILMEGTNDVVRLSNETIVHNLLAMVSRGRARGFGHVLLATVIPRGPGANPPVREATEQLADEIRQAAFELQIVRPDPFQTFSDAPNFQSIYTTLDHVHPNALGYDLLADTFADVLLDRDQLAPAPSFVQPAAETDNVAASAELSVVLFDAQSGVDLTSATLTVNGAPVLTTVSGSAARATLSARPGNLHGSSSLGVDASDLASPPNHRLEVVSNFTAVAAPPLLGDIDRSGRVDGADLIVLARAFGTERGDDRFNARADLDDNDSVDGADLALLAANFGLSSF